MTDEDIMRFEDDGGPCPEALRAARAAQYQGDSLGGGIGFNDEPLYSSLPFGDFTFGVDFGTDDRTAYWGPVTRRSAWERLKAWLVDK